MVQSDENVIEAVGLTKVFRDFWLRERVTAVSELDLQVHRREVFGLLGPNGSGKSTTLKMILGLLFPTRGLLSVLGRRPTDVQTKARIGFLPEESYLYPFLDARETLDFYGRLFHQDRRERHRRIDMLLDMVGLASVAYRRVGEYSKGMQRRIGLAQALINDPELLILDEPTSGMDPIGASQFKDLIRTLAARGKTIILSSHLLADVEDVCDRVCILYGGKARKLGSIDELLSQGDRTQITTGRLDDATIAKLRQLLASAGSDIVDVTAPRDRLETLFLRIVKEAQDQRLATGGAVGGGQVAEFLRGAEQADGRGIIDELVSAAKPSAATVPSTAIAPPPAQEPDKGVLADLLSARGEQEPGAAPPPAKSTAPGKLPVPKADRKVIDELLARNDDRKEKS